MTTAAEMNTALGTTNAQLAKVGEFLDAVSPKKVEGTSDPRANDVNDFRDHIVQHYTALYQSWKHSITPPPEF